MRCRPQVADGRVETIHVAETPQTSDCPPRSHFLPTLAIHALPLLCLARSRRTAQWERTVRGESSREPSCPGARRAAKSPLTPLC
jgi:hypothetical protein